MNQTPTHGLLKGLKTEGSPLLLMYFGSSNLITTFPLASHGRRHTRCSIDSIKNAPPPPLKGSLKLTEEGNTSVSTSPTCFTKGCHSKSSIILAKIDKTQHTIREDKVILRQEKKRQCIFHFLCLFYVFIIIFIF